MSPSTLSLLEEHKFRAGEGISLSCDRAPDNCSSITWLFSSKTAAVALFENGNFKSEDNIERLHVTTKCSLEVKPLRKEDEGLYTCRSFPLGGHVDHARHILELISKYLYYNLFTKFTKLTLLG